MSYIEQREIAYEFCRENLIELCSELLEWQTTGLLCDGKFRMLADLLKFADYHAMAMAEESVKTEAMKMVIRNNA